MKPRDYQIEAVDKVFSMWESGKNSVIGVAATGLGKSVIIANIIKRLNGRAMVLVHTRLLVKQLHKTIKEHTGFNCEIEMADLKVTLDSNLRPVARVIVSTVQTQTGSSGNNPRMSKFLPDDIACVIIDECVMAAADSYQKLLAHYCKNPNLKICGITACPTRSDNRSLGKVFQDVAFDEYDIKYGRDNGWLVDVRQRIVYVDSMDISAVSKAAGELNGAELRAVVESETPMQKMAQAIFEIIHGLPPKTLSEFEPEEWASKVIGIKPKRAIAFTRFVSHAKLLSDILNRISFGISAWACGETDEGERDKIISDFKGDIGATILVNANLLVMGYDDSGVEFVFQCCPMLALSRYLQTVGRVTRPHDSIAHRLGSIGSPAMRRALIARSPKPVGHVIDFVGNSGKHKLVSMLDVLAGDMDYEIIQKAKKRIQESGESVRPEQILEEEVNKRIEEKKKKELAEAAKRAKLVAKLEYSTREVDPFLLSELSPVKMESVKEHKELSPKMFKILVTQGYDPVKMGYEAAKAMAITLAVRFKKGLCHPDTVLKLSKYGINANNFTRVEGKQAWEYLAKTGWKRTGNENFKPAITIDKSDDPY